MMGGLSSEWRSRKAYIHEEAFEVKEQNQCPERTFPSSWPPVCQGNQLACVPCSIAWLSNFLSGAYQYEWKALFAQLDIRGQGSKPKEALDLAKKMGWFGSYYEIQDKSYSNLTRILLDAPILIGVPCHELFWAGTYQSKPLQWDGKRDYGHMVVLKDLAADGSYRVVSWSDEKEQYTRLLSKDYPVECAYTIDLRKLPEGEKPTASIWITLIENLSRFVKAINGV